jgi:hypothetical protein
MSYATGDIRQYLIEFYSDEDLTTLCFDYFPAVYSRFAVGMAKDQKIQFLLEHCRQHDVMGNLLAALQRERPEQYAQQFTAPMAVEFPRRERDSQQIFVSHAHQDAVLAHKLASDLRNRGWRVWIVPESIQPGEKWVEAINRGLEECGIFIPLLTPSMVASRWAMREADAAIAAENAGHMRLIPIEIEVCQVPALLNSYQRISFVGDYQAGLAELLRAIKSSARPPGAEPAAQDLGLAPSRPAAEPPRASRPRPASPQGQKRLSASSMLLAAGCVFAILVCVVSASFLSRVWKPAGPQPQANISPTHTRLVPPAATTAVARLPTSTAAATSVPRLPTSTATPALLYKSGLVTYTSQDEHRNKQLYALRADGVAIALTQAYSDVVVLSISPDSRYIALAVSNQGTLSPNTDYPRFWGGKPGTDLVVVSVDSQKQNTGLSGPSAFSASYLSDGQLLIALLEKSTVIYYMSGADGTGWREVYKSINKLFTPTATATRSPSP